MRDALGEINDLRNLGQLDIRKGFFSAAKDKFKAVPMLHRQVLDVSLAKEDFKAAKDSFNNALKLRRQSNDP